MSGTELTELIYLEQGSQQLPKKNFVKKLLLCVGQEIEVVGVSHKFTKLGKIVIHEQI
jgi:hypothetical protein